MSDRPALPDTAPDLSAQIEALREALAALEKQVGRSGREQFKANTLAETQAAQLAEALGDLRRAAERREDELAALREQSLRDQAAARLEVVRALLPALDSLDQAIRSGRQVLSQHAQRQSPEQLLRRLLQIPAEPAEGDALRGALSAWLSGLDLVRRRLLDTLAAEGVTPIAAEGHPFDPAYHIALETIATTDAPRGQIVHEIRRGYLAGERVLRYAEVAVAVGP